MVDVQLQEQKQSPFLPKMYGASIEPEIKETLAKLLDLWKKYKWRMWEEEEVSINQLLSKGNNA